MEYDLHISQQLMFEIAGTLGVSTNDVLSFFDDTIHQMMDCKPNLVRKPYSKAVDNQEIGIPIRVLRGYYPGTGIFFKIILTTFSENMGGHHRAKVSTPAQLRHPIRLVFDKCKLKEFMAERELLAYEGEELIPFKKQRLMTPKGMKPLEFVPKNKRPKTETI